MFLKNSKFESIEYVNTIDIKFSGSITQLKQVKGEFILQLSKTRTDLNLFTVFFNRDKHFLMEELESQDKITVSELVLRKNLDARLLYQIEGKAVAIGDNDEESAVFGRAKLVHSVQLYFNPYNDAIRMDEKSYRSYQGGFQKDGQRTFYYAKDTLQSNISNLVFALKDQKIDKRFLLPEDWSVELIEEVKSKELIKVRFRRTEPNELATHSHAANEPTKSQPTLLYFGLATSVYIFLAINNDWWVPFTSDKNFALAIALCIIGIGLASFFFRKKNSYVAIGAVLLTIGMVGEWQQWVIPVIEVPRYLSYAGLASLGVGLVPQVLAVLLLIGAFFFGIGTFMGYQQGAQEFPTGNVIVIAIMIVLGVWLVRRHKKLQRDGIFKN